MGEHLQLGSLFCCQLRAKGAQSSQSRVQADLDAQGISPAEAEAAVTPCWCRGSHTCCGSISCLLCVAERDIILREEARVCTQLVAGNELFQVCTWMEAVMAKRCQAFRSPLPMSLPTGTCLRTCQHSFVCTRYCLCCSYYLLPGLSRPAKDIFQS